LVFVFRGKTKHSTHRCISFLVAEPNAVKGFISLIDELAKDRPGNLDIGVARSDNGKFVIHDQNKLNDFKTKPTALQRIILASINESGSQVEKILVEEIQLVWK
ncbi:MAG: hypothetical protein ACFNPY_02215, partial [Peptidiphaga sp.]